MSIIKRIGPWVFLAVLTCAPAYAVKTLGAFSGVTLLLDTQIETPATNNRVQTLPEQKAGDTIRFQLFAPSGGGQTTNGYMLELDVSGKSLASYIGTISGVDWDGNALIGRGAATLSALFVTGATVPSSGYLGQVNVSVTRALEAGARLVVKRMEIISGRDVDSLAVAAAEITFTTGGNAGDFNNDGSVDLSDFLAFASMFGTSAGASGYDARGDFDNDGSINLSDFLTFASVFGTTYPVGGGGGSPDLVVNSPSVSDASLTPGESFTLRATVRNAGGAASASTTLRYYRSSDAAISTSDTEVGTDAVGALDASGTSDESIGLNAPSSAGEYYYGACVESVSEESDTGNNCSGGVRVTVTASNGGSGGNLGKCAVGMVVKPNQRCSVGSAEFINIGGGCYQFTAFGTGRICGSGFNLNGLRGTRSGSDFRITAVP